MTVTNPTTGINPLNRWGGIITRDAYRGVNIGLNLGRFMNATNFEDEKIISESLGRCAYVVGGLAAASCGLVGGMVGVAHAVGNALGNALNGNNKLDKNPLYILEDTSHKKLQKTLKELIDKKWDNLFNFKVDNIDSEQQSYHKTECLSAKELKEIFKEVFTTKKFKDIEKEVSNTMDVSFELNAGEEKKTATHHIADYINEAVYINKTPDNIDTTTQNQQSLKDFAQDVITKAKVKAKEKKAQLEEDAKKAEKEKEAQLEAEANKAEEEEKAKKEAKLLAQAQAQAQAQARQAEEARKKAEAEKTEEKKRLAERPFRQKMIEGAINFSSNTIAGTYNISKWGAGFGTILGLGTAGAGVGVGGFGIATAGAMVVGGVQGIVQAPIILANAVKDAVKKQSQSS